MCYRYCSIFVTSFLYDFFLFDLIRFRLIWFVLSILVKFDYFTNSGNAPFNLINDFVTLVTFIINLLIVKTIIIFNEHGNYHIKLKSQFYRILLISQFKRI